MYFVRAETYAWKVLQGAEATTGAEAAPALDATMTWLADITLDYRLTHLPDPHQEYDLYLSVLRGGNGLGDVLERDERLIEDDLNEGLLLPRFLDSVYGAVAHQDDTGTWSVDHAATAARREEKRKERLERSMPVAEWIASERERVVNKDFIEPVSQMYQESMELSESWAKQFREFWNLPEDYLL